MKSLLNRRTILIAVIALIIAASTVLSINLAGNNGFVTNAATAVSIPLKSLVSSVARMFESIYGSIARYDKLVEDYEKALGEISELRSAFREYTEASEENKRLYALLEFREKHGGKYTPAVIRGWNAPNWSSSFTISRGSENSDIEVGDSIVTEYGVLIGRVSEVYKTTSVALSILDTTFAASAYVGEVGGAATVSGDFALMSRGLLKIDHIVDEKDIVPGDTVVTSGKGGVYPGGLIVGTVVEMLDHPTGIGRYATVSPMIHLDLVTHVYVITEFDVME